MLVNSFFTKLGLKWTLLFKENGVKVCSSYVFNGRVISVYGRVRLPAVFTVRFRKLI